MMTTAQVAQHLGVTRQAVLAWVHEGRLAATRLVNGSYVFSEETVEAFAADRATA